MTIQLTEPAEAERLRLIATRLLAEFQDTLQMLQEAGCSEAGITAYLNTVPGNED